MSARKNRYRPDRTAALRGRQDARRTHAQKGATMATGKSKSKGRSRKFRYDTYMIEVPEDLGDEQERLDQAIIEAYGRARLYVMPAVWTATTTDDPGVVRVVRKRRAPQYTQA